MTVALDYQLPPALAKIPAIRRIYPDLYYRVTRQGQIVAERLPRGLTAIENFAPDLLVRENARPNGSLAHLHRMLRHRWRAVHPAAVRAERATYNRLRKQARTRWVRQHPAHPAAITAYVRWGGSIEVAFHRVWDAYGIPEWRQRRLDCFVEHEGGYDRMDRWYAGSTGWQPIVQRDGTTRGRFEGTDRVLGPGQIRPYHARLTHPEVLDSVVTERTFAVLTNPFDHARTMYLVGDHAYATLGACS